MWNAFSVWCTFSDFSESSVLVFALNQSLCESLHSSMATAEQDDRYSMTEVSVPRSYRSQLSKKRNVLLETPGYLHLPAGKLVRVSAVALAVAT